MKKKIHIINEDTPNDCLKVLLEEKRRREKIKYVWKTEEGAFVSVKEMTDLFLDRCISKTKKDVFL